MSGWTGRIPFGDDPALERGLVQVVDRVADGHLLPIIGLLLAAGIGALHALGPGHGKVLISAYLVSGRGRLRDAGGLAVLVAAMHTVTVLLVGLGLALTQQTALGTRLESALRVVIAVGVTALGLVMLRRARGADHAHLPPPEVAPLSRAGIAAVASSGGLLPSPAAVLMLLTFVALDRPMVGVAMVASFGLGLAVTLGALGAVVLLGGRRLHASHHRSGTLRRVSRVVPTLSGAAVTLVGVFLLVTAVTA